MSTPKPTRAISTCSTLCPFYESATPFYGYCKVFVDPNQFPPSNAVPTGQLCNYKLTNRRLEQIKGEKEKARIFTEKEAWTLSAILTSKNIHINKVNL